MTASAPIEFWFDFSSPYGYFAAQEVETVADRHGRNIRWRPFLLGAVFRTTGMRPLDDIPLRGEYARHDWARLARRLGLPFVLPPGFPFGAVAASRAFYWLESVRPETAVPFARAVYRAAFGEGRDVTERKVVVDIAADLGADAATLDTALDEPEVKQRLHEVSDEALRRGVFGSPFVIVDGEPFWGADRLPMVDEWLARGGW